MKGVAAFMPGCLTPVSVELSCICDHIQAAACTDSVVTGSVVASVDLHFPQIMLIYIVPIRIVSSHCICEADISL